MRGAPEKTAEAFRVGAGYEAPYWTLVTLARESLAGLRVGLRPALAGI